MEINMFTYYLYTFRYLAASIVVYLIYKYLSKYFAKIEERKLKILSLENSINILEESVENLRIFTDSIPNGATIKELKDLSIEFHYEDNIDLYEPRARRYSGYSGIRVVKGVYIGGSTAKSVQEQTYLSTGNLTLYADELIYASSLDTRTIKLLNIVDTEAFTDGVRFSIKNRQKPTTFSGIENPVLLINYINLLKKLLVTFNKNVWDKQELQIEIKKIEKEFKDALETYYKNLEELRTKE